jgi:hypothetical protein
MTSRPSFGFPDEDAREAHSCRRVAASRSAAQPRPAFNRIWWLSLVLPLNVASAQDSSDAPATARRELSDTVAAIQEVRKHIDDFYLERRACPQSLRDAGVKPDPHGVTPYYIEVGSDKDGCYVEAILGLKHGSRLLRAKYVGFKGRLLASGYLRWTCYSNVAMRWLPASCKKFKP